MTTAAANKLEDYYETLKPLNLAPLWVRLKGLVPSEPMPKAIPFRWAWSPTRDALITSGSLISAKEAERRVLVLENPGLAGQSKITDTLYAGLQLILPGELAPAHRHTQSALRFCLEGEGAVTSVDGERTTMHRGDFIITPFWTWHDHKHEGDEPVIWLDGLDVPLVTALCAGFREEHTDEDQEITRPEGDALARYGNNLLPLDHSVSRTSPVFSYPYGRTRESLDSLARTGPVDPHHGITLRYINPTNGDWAIPTIGAMMRLIPAGFETRPYRATNSEVVVVLEGGLDVAVGQDPYVRLSRNDIMSIPGWSRVRYRAVDGDAIAFCFSDRPVHEKLGLFREDRG
ncbi:gentisate 1,2-dioxygenase [Rhizobium leguminosarum bv. viciae]|uniref:Gentisate 1,2-dioxygenase n=1 Tax=Rhizobium leguminosarum bv. viciae TaxID=387 RepID=A0A8I2KL30_RHILV|nr:gentisate 1,2-dioxygenase [Rhizobium leguminosarum]MBY5419945.1 gentisate 1,2-dioxygenase [Rhizobium leguminosarum]MBY5427092.1 gentisate 1,2-dioxygenase [Rhizobium leguminosarum]MBY5794002.1 gentisate 1,2-dioxygenase [Rhizobium leguminosarum]NKK29920.1 gentisate 1,2-dioxygenase [Rhizobium leguminosarum bv. viciae]NKK39331.1 gentisate 1,2-dioxygenase [Rhizobium leguminosarum bv. viciae]